MLRIRNLSVVRHHRDLLHDVSLDIEAGSIFSITGPNGAGKSTLLRTLVGLVPPQEGIITFQDRDLFRLSAKHRAQLIAYLPQTMTDDLPYRVDDAIAFGNFPWQDHCDPEDVRHRIDSALNLCRVETFRNRSVSTLSGGERQRVFLAQVIVQNTPIILLDEPTVFLDLKNQILFEDILVRLRKENKTILFVSHDLHSTRRIANHVAALKDGRILFQGNPAQAFTIEQIAELFDTDPAMIRHWCENTLINGESN